VFNTLVNNRANVQMSSRRRPFGANDLVFANNIIVGGDKAVTIDGPLANPTWEGNILWHNDGGPGDIPASGFVDQDPGLAARGQGGAVQKSAPSVGNGAGDYPYVTIDVDGQPRGAAKTIGADQPSSAPVANRAFTPADVGPNAPAEDRPWISAPSAD
jgi:poly(beta-D-mannuronate) lyase